MRLFELLNPYWTIKILKERNKGLQDNVDWAKNRATFWECEALKAYRAMRGMGIGIRRLHEKNKVLKQQLASEKHLVRALRQKLGEQE
jgi:hypothetical protein